jgi:16S rRNA (guanine527-N7)-methyltransferase
VKHALLVDELHRYLNLSGIDVSPAQLELSARHIELVLEANHRVNLTRVTNPCDAVRLHTADSLTVLPELGSAPEGALLDLGSGAGFPGIPLAICSSRQVTLLDSVGKKVRELTLIISGLGMADRVTALADRAETLASTRRAAFSVVTARAVSELPALVELAAPLLQRGGTLICLKGSPPSEELDRADSVGQLVGMRLVQVRSFDLPEGAGHRTVLCYERLAGSQFNLPRRVGLAQHSPLA